MNNLIPTLQGLTDTQALSLLLRLLQVLPLPRSSQSGASMQARAQTLAAVNSLSPASTASSTTPGALARSALQALAELPDVTPVLHHLLALQTTSLQAFTNPLPVAELSTQLLAVLEWQLAGSAGNTSANATALGGLRTLAEQVLASIAPTSATPQADAEVRVWYATTRKPLPTPAGSPSYGPEREDETQLQTHGPHCGSCTVRVPRSHKVGSLGSPWWKRVFGPDDRLQLLHTDPAANADAFWHSMAQHIASCLDSERDAVLFVHGYNVSFEQAALRAAQLGFDLQVRGAMAFFSWASRGELARYPADEATVELEDGHLAQFLRQLAQRSGARRVHLIAHSMGNRAVLRALQRIAAQVSQPTDGQAAVPLGQIILAAPDVDARLFLQHSHVYPQLAQRTTLYVSTRDKAVGASHWLHDAPRVGLMPPVTVAPGIDTINVVNADITLLGHGYVAEARDVVADIHALLTHGSAPAQRFGLRSVLSETSLPYWLLGA